MNSNNKNNVVKLFADQFCYAWNIYDYCFCSLSDKESISSEFKTEDNNDYVWYFKLVKETAKPYNGVIRGHNLTLNLHLKNCENPDFCFNETITVELGFLDKDSNCFKISNPIFDPNAKCFYNSYHISADNRTHESCRLINNLKITVYCKIKNIQLKKPKRNKFDGLSNDLEQIFKNEKFSDVIIVVGEKKFHVHKVILASRSAVFSAMFENEMKEKKENKIDITDIAEDVMQEVLRFVYTGKIENHNIAIDILAAAEKYAIEDLKIECSEILSESLKINNVTEIFALANLYKANNLKKAAVEFIAVHVNELAKTLGSIAISDS